MAMFVPEPPKRDDATRCQLMYREPEMMMEEFSAVEDPSDKPQTQSQTIFLTSPDDENKNPMHMMEGVATRIVTDSQVMIDISARLYVLNGNVYGEQKEQAYSAYLRNDKTNQKITAGTLEKDGDGVYKLKYVSRNAKKDLLDFTELYIVFKNDSTKYHIMLQGEFESPRVL
jgi:hypothetical protein